MKKKFTSSYSKKIHSVVFIYIISSFFTFLGLALLSLLIALLLNDLGGAEEREEIFFLAAKLNFGIAVFIFLLLKTGLKVIFYGLLVTIFAYFFFLDENLYISILSFLFTLILIGFLQIKNKEGISAWNALK